MERMILIFWSHWSIQRVSSKTRIDLIKQIMTLKNGIRMGIKLDGENAVLNAILFDEYKIEKKMFF